MIEDEINDILRKWNPLEVPSFIAEYEYKSYISNILNHIHDEGKLQIYLIDLLENTMGLTVKDSSEIAEVSKKIAMLAL